MNVNSQSRLNKQRGSTYIATLIIVGGLGVAGMSYLNRSSNVLRDARRKAVDAQLTQLADAGTQACLRTLWRDFKATQSFDNLETSCVNASESSPKATSTGVLSGVGRYSAGVIWYRRPEGDDYTRQLTVRVSSWIDTDNDGQLDANESVKLVDVKASFQLSRSQVFDYTYFVNNYGWMDGFTQSNLVINGDMRANGDFSFLNGVPTVNGTIIATANDKLSSGRSGTLTGAPVKWNNSTYASAQSSGSDDNEARWRQAYDATKHGARDSNNYKAWQDIIFDSQASIQNDRIAGAALVDASGSKGWTRESSSATPTTSMIDPAASQEVIMPDLGDLVDYQTLSANYVDNRVTFTDGTANPYSGQGAWVDVWNSSTSTYQRISTNGYVNGSAILIGTATRPIKIHGPVTFAQDVVIKGTVEGQGTLYAGRNVHIVGSLRYKNKPDFRGSSPTAIDNANEKDDLMGLAARGSVIMGNPNTFTSQTLQYMQPPFTKGRYDDNGNWVPPYNGLETDSSGKQKYKSVISDSTMASIAEGINQLDAVVYTNFLGGGNLGTSGGGVIFNGSIISRDEAMVIFSLPMRMNYDSRIRERSASQKPLIDIKLPRSPVLMRSTWQQRGISYGF